MASNLLTFIVEDVYKIIFDNTPKDFENYEVNKKYNFYMKRKDLGFQISREVYTEQLYPFGIITEIVDSDTNKKYKKHTLNINFPSWINTTRSFEYAKKYVITIFINTLNYIYGFNDYSISFSCDYDVVVNPSEIEIVIDGDPKNTPQNINLFDELHQTEIKTQRLVNTDRLYGSKYEYDTNLYLWKKGSQTFPKGDLSITNESTNTVYDLYNSSKKIVSVKLKVRPYVTKVIHQPEYVNWEKKIDISKNNTVVSQTLYRVVFIQPLVIKKINEPERDFDYLKLSSYKWYYLSDIPTIEKIKEREDIFKKKVINIQPEAILYNHVDIGLNEKYIKAKDTALITESMIKLQKNWHVDYSSKNPFKILRSIWKLLEDVKEVGVYLSRTYFTFDGKTLMNDKIQYAQQTGTYIKTITSNQKITPFYYPLSTPITYTDKYSQWQNGKITEEKLFSEDVELVYYFNEPPQKKNLLPSYFKNSSFSLELTPDQKCLFFSDKYEYIYHGSHQKKLDISFENKIKKRVIVNGSFIFETVKTSIRIYTFNDISVINDDNSIYKYFKDVKCYKLHFQILFSIVKQSNERVNVFEQIENKANVSVYLDKSQKIKQPWDDSGLLSLQVGKTGQYIGIDLKVTFFDVRSQKITKNLYTWGISWNHVIHGKLYGVPSLWNIDPDEYKIDFEYPYFKIAIGSTIANYYDKATEIHYEITTLSNEINIFKGGELLFTQLRKLFDLEFEFNKTQPWYKGKKKTNIEIKKMFNLT